MKQILSAMLVLLMLGVLFVGCQDSQQGEKGTTVDNTSVNETDITSSDDSSESESNSTDESESENMPAIEKEPKNVFVSLCDYTSDAGGAATLKAGINSGAIFTVPSGYLTDINILCHNSGSELGGIKFSLYAWDTDYNTTVAKEPVYQNVFDKFLNGTCLMVNFEKGKIPAGRYLYLLSVPETNTAANIVGPFNGPGWTSRTLPEEYKKYDIEFVQNGRKLKAGMMANFSYTCDMPKEDIIPEKVTSDKDPDGTVKVILLAGQSNATGVSLNSMLQQNVGEEKYSRYKNGFSRVKILYKCENGSNQSEGFVDVKPGQGCNTATFGPELGLAEYLEDTYPDETFYIIKVAIGGSVLDTEWFAAREEGGAEGKYLTDFKLKINEGLNILKSEGLNPKIVSFMWMQGESDAIFVKTAFKFYDSQLALINDIRTTFKDDSSVRGISFIDSGAFNAPYWTAYKKINDSKYRISLLSDANFYIDTIGNGITTLYENNDLAHYDSMSMIKLSHLYGQALSQFID